MAVTDYRWHKIPFGTNEEDPRCKALVQTITGILSQKFNEGISHVICGMTLGFDTFVAETVIRLRQDKCSHITFEAALFCSDQSEPWTPRQKERFEEILRYCVDSPTVIGSAYKKGCGMLKRNKYMVDNSCTLLVC